MLQKTKCSFCQSFLCICHLLTQEFILLYGPYATELEPTSSIGGSYHHLLFLRLCLSHKPISITIPNSEQCSKQHSVIQMCVFKWFYCTSWIIHIAQLGKAYTFLLQAWCFIFCVCKFILKGNFLICCGQILFRILKCALQCLHPFAAIWLVAIRDLLISQEE